jgi:5,5'-dehydrodivanillate O-demethylase
MLSTAENERLARVGPGTPGGNLLRRYWHPIAGVSEMRAIFTKRVRLLGEDLVLFRDRGGRFGLIAEQCPHRRASMAYGIPALDGIRCPYHGWKFDASGACLEQPNEPAGSSFKDKVATTAYPVEELAGLLWAYLGPLPAPLIPRLDGFVVPGTIRCTPNGCTAICKSSSRSSATASNRNTRSRATTSTSRSKSSSSASSNGV